MNLGGTMHTDPDTWVRCAEYKPGNVMGLAILDYVNIIKPVGPSY
jgi:hypothetical protein